MKLAAYFGESASDPSSIVTRMLHHQRMRPWQRPRVFVTPGAAIGMLHTDDGDHRLCSTSRDGHQRLVMAGMPLPSLPSVATWMDSTAGLPAAAAVESLVSADGSYVAVLWDERSRRCTVVTDALGMQPLYMVRRPGALALASDARALTASGVTDYRISLAGWGAFLSFQHPIGGLTLAEDVVRLPPGAVLTYDVPRGSLSCRQHTAWPEVLPDAAIDDRFIDDLATAFVEDVEACRRHHGDGAVLLSGGYDSRLVLAALVDSGASALALVHDHGDEVFGLDSRLARRVAKSFGVSLERLRTARHFFSSAAYIDYVVASEVSVPSLYLFITQMGDSLPHAVDAVWEGTFPGCFLFPVHQPPGGFAEYLAREAGDGNAGLWQAASCVFNRGVLQDMRAAFDQALAEERSRYADNAHGVSEFVVKNRTRRRVAVNAFQVYSNDVRPLTPGLRRAFWRRAASISYDVKAGHRLYRRLLRRRFPRAMRIPFMSGGVLHPPDSAAWLRGTAPWLAARLNSPGAQRALWRLGVRCGDYYWQPSEFVHEAVAATSPGDPDLNRQAVSRLQRLSPPFDATTEAARTLLFYRLMAQRVFSGTVSATLRVAADAGDQERSHRRLGHEDSLPIESASMSRA